MEASGAVRAPHVVMLAFFENGMSEEIALQGGRAYRGIRCTSARIRTCVEHPNPPFDSPSSSRLPSDSESMSALAVEAHLVHA